jgi:hypothetical protein
MGSPTLQTLQEPILLLPWGLLARCRLSEHWAALAVRRHAHGADLHRLTLEGGSLSQAGEW